MLNLRQLLILSFVTVIALFLIVNRNAISAIGLDSPTQRTYEKAINAKMGTDLWKTEDSDIKHFSDDLTNIKYGLGYDQLLNSFGLILAKTGKDITHKVIMELLENTEKYISKSNSNNKYIGDRKLAVISQEMDEMNLAIDRKINQLDKEINLSNMEETLKETKKPSGKPTGFFKVLTKPETNSDVKMNQNKNDKQSITMGNNLMRIRNSYTGKSLHDDKGKTRGNNSFKNSNGFDSINTIFRSSSKWTALIIVLSVFTGLFFVIRKMLANNRNKRKTDVQKKYDNSFLRYIDPDFPKKTIRFN